MNEEMHVLEAQILKAIEESRNEPQPLVKQKMLAESIMAKAYHHAADAVRDRDPYVTFEDIEGYLRVLSDHALNAATEYANVLAGKPATGEPA